jgi:hypothetical protein
MGALVLSIFSVLGGINDWPRLVDRYPTAIPWEVFRFTLLIGIGLGIIVNFLIFTVSLAAGASSWPELLPALAKPRARSRGLPDALLAAAAALALILGTRHLAEVAVQTWPALAPVPRLGLPRSAEGLWASIGAAWTIIRASVLVVGLGAGVLALLHGRLRRPATWGILALLWLRLAAPGAHSFGEFALALVLSGIQLGAILLAVRVLFRSSPLAWILSVLTIVTASTLWPYFEGAGEAYHRAGGIALGLVIVPVVALGFLRLPSKGSNP